ncbi:MAG TPA: 2-octaprenyl-6-methoxyphenyl hydroxylase, partial [Rubrivivax sp.]|nr:2-octaprenyl-6-methoxyphenyl hydroxylase [Rubrivivax sp.]
MQTAWRLAVVGAGPAGLALALHASRLLPHAQITLFDAQPADRDCRGDPRTLALSLGSVQFLRRLQAWPAGAAAAITEVQVSQMPPTLNTRRGEAVVCLRAADLAVPQLGAVLAYGDLVHTLQQAWAAATAAQPQRLRSRFGTPVAAIKALPAGVEIDTGIAEAHDLAVIAEGGVFAGQARKAVAADYRQTAWVGTVSLAGATPGLAIERF